MTDWWGEGPLPEWPEWKTLRSGDALAPLDELSMDETYVTHYQGMIYGINCSWWSSLDERRRMMVVRRYYRPSTAPGFDYDYIATEDVADIPAAIEDVMTHLPDRLLEWLL